MQSGREAHSSASRRRSARYARSAGRVARSVTRFSSLRNSGMSREWNSVMSYQSMVLSKLKDESSSAGKTLWRAFSGSNSISTSPEGPRKRAFIGTLHPLLAPPDFWIVMGKTIPVGKWFAYSVTRICSKTGAGGVLRSTGPMCMNPSKGGRCRGPESNWRHMVLQTIALPTELPRRDPHFTGKLVHPSAPKESDARASV